MTTNINCSTDCVHQDCGKCTLNQVSTASATGDENCAYFKKNNRKKHNDLSNKNCNGPDCR